MNYQQKMQLRRWLQKPLWTYTFLGIQTIVFLLAYLLPSLQIESAGGMFGPLIVFYHEYWRFITPIFIHFGLMHFAVNSVMLYFMGEQMESVYGHWRYFLIYMLSGIMGNMASFAMNQPGVLSAGASTSLFGLFGAIFALALNFRNTPSITMMARQFLMFIGLSLLFSLFDSTIDIWGHLGGVIGGFLIGNIVGVANQNERYSIHQRVISALFFIFIAVICLLLGLKKYGLLV